MGHSTHGAAACRKMPPYELNRHYNNSIVRARDKKYALPCFDYSLGRKKDR
jgi:hypothetical protein